MKRLIFLIVGVALIVFAFVILVNETPWPKQIWLDLCVVILVYGFNVLS